MVFAWWQSRSSRGRRSRSPGKPLPPRVEQLEDRALPHGHSAAAATALALNDLRAGVRGDAGSLADYFAATPAESGRLTVRAHAEVGDTRLSLLGPDGLLLAQSDGASAADRDDLIDRHLAAGAADFNQDGHLDLAFADDTDERVSVLLGRGDGTFRAHVTFSAGATSKDLRVTDLNNDGLPDLVAANWLSNRLTPLLGRGDGTFLTPDPGGTVSGN